MPTKQPAWLYDATRQTVHRERGTAKVIADAIDRREHAVTDLADPLRHVALKAYDIPAMVNATGCYAVLDVLEAKVGRVAFKLPTVNPRVDEMQRELARAVKQFGEFLETNGDVLADGRVERHEAAMVVKSLDAMIADLSEYRALIVEKAERDAA